MAAYSQSWEKGDHNKCENPYEEGKTCSHCHVVVETYRRKKVTTKMCALWNGLPKEK